MLEADHRVLFASVVKYKVDEARAHLPDDILVVAALIYSSPRVKHRVKGQRDVIDKITGRAKAGAYGTDQTHDLSVTMKELVGKRTTLSKSGHVRRLGAFHFKKRAMAIDCLSESRYNRWQYGTPSLMSAT